MKQSKEEFKTAVINVGEMMGMKDATEYLLKINGIYSTVQMIVFNIFTTGIDQNNESVSLIREYCQEMKLNGQVDFNDTSKIPEIILTDYIKGVKEYIVDNINGTYYKSEKGLFGFYDADDCYFVYDQKISREIKSYFGDAIKEAEFVKQFVDKHLKLKVNVICVSAIEFTHRLNNQLKQK